MTDNGRILRNLLMTVSSEGLGGILSFVIVLVTARLLGVAEFGVFSYILAITGICQLVADFGLTNLIVREVAKNRDKATYIMSNVLSMSWVLSILILLVVSVVTWLTLETDIEKIAALLMTVAVLAIYHSVVYSSVCRAFERMEYNAISFVVHKIILLGLIFFFIGDFSPVASPLIGISLSYLIANLLQYLYFFIIVRTRFIRFGFGRDYQFCIELIQHALPIGASMVIRRATLHVDVIILTLLATPVAVGVFSSAYKVVQVVDMIPFALCLPLYPALTRLAHSSAENLQTFFARTLDGFLIIAFPMAGFLAFFSGNLITLFYGKGYESAADVLGILAFTVIGLFVNMLMSYLFMSLNKQRYYLIAAAACLLMNALLDLLLIPSLGAVGAAWGTLAGELTYFVLCVYFFGKVGLVYPWLVQIWRPVGLTLLAIFICSLWSPASLIEVAALALAFFLIYGIGIVLVGVIKITEIRQVVLLLKGSQTKAPLPK